MKFEKNAGTRTPSGNLEEVYYPVGKSDILIQFKSEKYME